MIDDEKRKAYDNNLVNIGEVSENILTEAERKKAIPIFHISKSKSSNNSLARIREKIQEKEAGELVDAMLKRDRISGKDLKPYYNALKPEEEETNRASYSVSLKPKELLIEVEAKDSTALRAMINSITGIISIVDKTRKWQ